MTNTKVHRKLRVLLAGAVIILAGVMLAACSDPGPDVSVNTTAVTKSECSAQYKDGAQFQTCVITMPDTRRVTCIVNSGVIQAMSCDWIHADGSDYMGADE